MRKDPHQKSHAAAWVAAVAAIPVLYLVSVPPVVIMTQVWGKPPSMDPFAPPPYVKSDYYRPYLWLKNNTALSSGLHAYEQMWINVL